MATATTLRNMTDDQLLDEHTNVTQELFNLRFQFATGQTDKSSQLGALRRDIARIKTILREREIAAAEAGLEPPSRVRSAKPEPATAEPAMAEPAAAVEPADSPAEQAEDSPEEDSLVEQAEDSPEETSPAMEQPETSSEEVSPKEVSPKEASPKEASNE